jgi:hypothetical protein
VQDGVYHGVDDTLQRCPFVARFRQVEKELPFGLLRGSVELASVASPASDQEVPCGPEAPTSAWSVPHEQEGKPTGVGDLAQRQLVKDEEVSGLNVRA